MRESALGMQLAANIKAGRKLFTAKAPRRRTSNATKAWVLMSEPDKLQEEQRMCDVGRHWMWAAAKSIVDHVSLPADVIGDDNDLTPTYPTLDRECLGSFVIGCASRNEDLGVCLNLLFCEHRFEIARVEGPGMPSIVSYYQVRSMTKDFFVARVVLWLRRLKCQFDTKQFKALFELYLLTEQPPSQEAQ